MLRGVSSFVGHYQVVDVSETFGESASKVERPVEESTVAWFFTGKEAFPPDAFHGFLSRKLAGKLAPLRIQDIETVALHTTELSLFLSRQGLRGFGGAYAITCKAGGQVCRALDDLP